VQFIVAVRGALNRCGPLAIVQRTFPRSQRHCSQCHVSWEINMVVLFWSVKGGSGVTVVAAASALLSGRRAATTLVDLGGDMHAALGLPDPVGPGALDWLDATNGTPDGLFRLAVDVGDGLKVVAAGPRTYRDSHRPVVVDEWERLIAACSARREAVILDAGDGIPPPPVHECVSRSLLVTRPCFLALRRAAPHRSLASGVVLVNEPGRALTADDVERALGVPVDSELPWDPAVARAVDAGLLASRLPHGLVRALRHLTPAEAA
jgi:MinD-like ATPase involved in chromosome partitioning or flagellar assembly